MKNLVSICLCCAVSLCCGTNAQLWAQTPADSMETKQLEEVVIRGYRPWIEPISQLPTVHQSFIIAGKKNEVISLGNMPANLAEKTGRQIFAKIPGVFV